MTRYGRALPDMDSLRSMVAEFYRATHDSFADTASLPGIVAAHNQYTAYCALFALHATGHRTVRDPLSDVGAVSKYGAVIADKSVDGKDDYRFVPVAPSLLEQLNAYTEHLRGVARRLTRIAGGKALGNAIIDRLEQGCMEPSARPRFLLIDPGGSEGRTYGVSPAWLKRMLPTTWDWQLNTGRALLYTGLSERGVPHSLIRLLVGHQGPTEGAFDSGTWISPERYAKELLDPIEDVLRAQGWEVILGDRAPDRWKAKRASGFVSAPHADPFVGPDYRAQERLRRQRRAKQSVRVMLEGVVESSVDTPEKVEEAAGVLRSRLDESDPVISTYAVNLFLRVVRRRFRQHVRLRHLASSKRSPFSRFWPFEIERAMSVRERYSTYLANCGKDRNQTPAPVYQFAEIICSAGLYDHVGVADHLWLLAKSLPEQLSRHKQILVVDLCDEKGLRRRLVPGALTKALLIRGAREGLDGQAVSKKELLKVLRDLLAELGVRPNRSPMEELAYLARVLAKYECPGYLRKHRCEAALHQPLSHATMARAVYNQRIRVERTTENQPTENEVSIAPVFPLARDPKASGTATAYRRAMQATFSFSGRASAREREGKPNVRAIDQDLQRLFAADHQYPPVAVAIAEWGLHLCRRGTTRTRTLRPGTVHRYVNELVTALIPTAWGLPFFDLEAPELEELYADAINLRKSDRGRHYRAQRLREFHGVMVHQRGLPEIDWSGLPATDQPVGVLRLGTVVTAREYEAALQALRNDPDVSERQRLQNAAMLVLGYRCGLRSGEVVQLRLNDILLEDSAIVAHVHQSIYGRTKTVASVRMAPSLRDVAQSEVSLVRELCEIASHAVSAPGDNPGLFTAAEDARQPIDRNAGVARVQDALRAASGDGDIRYHSLRHTYATRAFAAMVADTERDNPAFVGLGLEPDNSADARCRFAGCPDTGDGMLRGLARNQGHADPATTLSNYIHLLDHVWTSKGPDDLPHAGWAYVAGVSAENARQRSSRSLPVVSDRALKLVDPARVELDKTTAVQLPPTRRRDITLSLVKIGEIVFHYRSLLDNPARISRIVDCDVDVVELLFEHAQELQRVSQYPGLALPGRAPLLVSEKTGAPPDSRRPKRDKRLLELLARWDAELNISSSSPMMNLQRYLHVWETSYDPALDAPRFTENCELEAMYWLVQNLGLKERAEILIPEDDTASSALEKSSHRYGWPITHWRALRDHSGSSSNRRGSPPRAAWRLLPERPGDLRNATLQRGLYVLALWLRLVRN